MRRLALALVLLCGATVAQDRVGAARELAPGVAVIEVRVDGARANVVRVRLGTENVLLDPIWPHGTAAVLTTGEGGHAVRTVVAVGSAQRAGGPDDVTVLHPRDLPLEATRAVAFEREIRLVAGDDVLVLRAIGRTASAAGVAAWVPRGRVVFAGLTVQDGPVHAGTDADSVAWRRALDDLASLEPRTVVPFSGPALDAGALPAMRDLIAASEAAVQDRLARVDEPRPAPDRATPSLIALLDAEATRGASGRLGSERGATVAIPVAPGETPALVVLAPALDAATRGAIRKVAPHVELIEVRDAAQAMRHAARAHACDARFATPELIAAAPNLRWVQAWSAGVERYLARDALRENEAIVMTNMRAMSGEPIADHAFGMLLQLTRHLGAHRDRALEGRWDRGLGVEHLELAGRTMLVVGLGGIGTAVARRAEAFGMRVLATDVRTSPKPPFVDSLEPPDRLDALLPLADVVAVCVPLTEQTRGLFGAERIARMKDGAFLVNVARGAIVDTEALLAALESGRLRGAALDVTDPEPLPSGHPLWSRSDVVITPHVAGRSPETDRRRRALFVENVRRFAHGEPLLNVVDKRRGY